MAKSKRTVNVAFANEQPMSLPMEVVEKWEPKNVTRIGTSTFFKVDDTYVSMKSKDYNDIYDGNSKSN